MEFVDINMASENVEIFLSNACIHFIRGVFQKETAIIRRMIVDNTRNSKQNS